MKRLFNLLEDNNIVQENEPEVEYSDDDFLDNLEDIRKRREARRKKNNDDKNTDDSPSMTSSGSYVNENGLPVEKLDGGKSALESLIRNTYISNANQWIDEKKALTDKIKADRRRGVNTHSVGYLLNAKINFQPTNLLIEGPAGGGKTGIIKSTLASMGIPTLYMTGANITTSMVRGVAVEGKDEYADLVSIKTFYRLGDNVDEEGNPMFTVLFIDEINRSLPEVRPALLSLIQDHYINDHKNMAGVRDLEYFLFTIAAQNPATASYGASGDGYDSIYPLEAAMDNRFAHYEWEVNKDVVREYLTSTIDKRLQAMDFMDRDSVLTMQKMLDISDPGKNGQRRHHSIAETQEYMEKEIRENRGRREIINMLLSGDITFDFDTPDKIDIKLTVDSDGKHRAFSSSRSITAALYNCDGTVEDFCAKLKSHCGFDDKDVKNTYNDFLGFMTQKVVGNEPFTLLGSRFSRWKNNHKKYIMDAKAAYPNDAKVIAE